MSHQICVAQFRPVKADPVASLERAEGVLEQAAAMSPRPRLLVFPEAALTGYFLEGGVRELALEAEVVFARLGEAWERVSTAGDPLDVVIGFFERGESRIHNAALYARLGGPDPGIAHVHRKVFLPTYGVFEEERFVDAGAGISAFDAAFGRAAMLICEDAFHSISGTLAALDGAELILIPSASPARGMRPGPGMPGSLARWDALAGGLAREHGVFVVVAQLVGFEGGKGFPGGSAVYGPQGERLVRGPLWEEALLAARLEPQEVLDARVEEPLLGDLERSWIRLLLHSPGAGVVGPVPRGSEATGPRAAPPTGADGAGAGAGQDARDEGRRLRAASPPGSPSASPSREAEETGREPRRAPNASGADLPEPDAEVGRGPDAAPRAADLPSRPAPREEARLPATAERQPWPSPEDATPLEIDTDLVEAWLLEFLRDEIVRRRGFRRVVVGISGGVDSSLTAALCARALGPEAVTGFLLPYRTSSPESAAHAELLADHLGIERRTMDITDAVDGYLREHEPEASAHRTGNVAARQRMIVLFDQAAKLEALPVGTGNKSERLLGYFTWHADDTPPINPLGDLFKVQVWALARAVGVPEEIVEKPASADLIRGQTDEEDLGISYPEADLILHHLLSGHSPERLVEAGFEAEKVRLVRQRLEGTHWKRHLPTVAMLTATTIGEWYLRPVDY